MRVRDLLAQKLDLNQIDPPMRNELTSLIAGVQGGLGIAFPPEVLQAFRRMKMEVPNTGLHDVIFLDRPEANAFIFLVQGKPTIALCKGMPFLMRALFLAALAEREVFAGLRDVHYLREPFTLTSRVRWDSLADLIDGFTFEKLFAWGRSLPTFPRSTDYSGRGDLAIVLSLQASMFLAFHEFGHFAMKHVEEAATGQTVQAYAEFDGSVPAARGGADLSDALLLRHANELEADRFAIAKLYVGFYRAHGALPSTTPNHAAMTKMSERSRSRLWLVMVGLVFLLFEVAGRHGAALTHPRALFRLRHLLQWTRGQTLAISSEGIEGFDRGCTEAMDDLTLIAEKLGLNKPFQTRSDDASYERRMEAVRAARERTFEEDA
jgi:hypothetical protein